MRLAQVTGINSPGSVFTDYKTLPSLLVSRFLQYAIIIAGFIFFAKLLSAGFSLLTSAGDQAKIQAATKDLTNAVIGLVIVITSFFIIQIIQTIFGFKITQ